MASSLTSSESVPREQLSNSETSQEPELGTMDDSGDECETDSKVSEETGARSKNPTISDKDDEQRKNGEEERKDSAFECNICLDVASDAVISMCGHLFCWPCLHQWLETRPHHQICPVCKAGIGKDKVVPLYGRGNADPKDPRDKPIPPRPRGQRPEPESSGNGQAPGFWGFGNGPAGFQMSFGIGAFPFGFFATNFNFGDGLMGTPDAAVGSPQYEEERFLHKVFLWIAFAFIFWLLIA